ncbi:hypothetical protein [Aquimarina algicola]|nr:hypothetical protein [Aquimarina algicola]
MASASTSYLSLGLPILSFGCRVAGLKNGVVASLDFEKKPPSPSFLKKG